MKPRRKQLFDQNTLVLLKQIGIGVVVIAFVGALITATWYGTRVESLTITSVEASGGETINPSTIEELATEALEGTYFGLVPRRFAWWYPEEEIHTKITELERVHNVSISRVSGTALQITYDEYVPLALWCTSVEDDGCVFLDTSGYAFAPAPTLSGGSFLRFVTLGRKTALTESVADKEIFDHLLSLVDLLAQQGWFISYVEIDQVGDAFLQIVGGGELKVLVAEPPEQTVENLQVVLGSDDFSHLKPGNFQYIDLRFGNKVFVNEEPVVSLDEEAVSE